MAGGVGLGGMTRGGRLEAKELIENSSFDVAASADIYNFGSANANQAPAFATRVRQLLGASRFFRPMRAGVFGIAAVSAACFNANFRR